MWAGLALIGIHVAAMALSLGVVATPAQAQARFGCACLHNQTQSLVKFRFKWGEKDWTNDTLKAGFQQTLCWQYASGTAASPNLTFQIDVDMTTGSAWTTYALARVQTATNACSAVASNFHYNISYRPNTSNSFIHLTRRP